MLAPRYGGRQIHGRTHEFLVWCLWIALGQPTMSLDD
jgi:hypothetical protein